jgi:hypothetical protein
MKTLLTATAILALSVGSAAACGWKSKDTVADLDVQQDRDRSTAKVERSEPETGGDGIELRSGTGDSVQLAETPERDDQANN